MSHYKRQQKSEVIRKDSGSSRPCPYGEAPCVRSYWCLNCRYCNGAVDGVSVYCGFKMEQN
ncbi:MAG: hypothetical protein PF569_09120 [Candidatus Woesearchaeota archaeon]|jgi:hypothetical protein|nr:hypothetical protein [Candidatus Woesearchaeota archaeon]